MPPFSQQFVSITLCLKNSLQGLSCSIQPHLPLQEKRIKLLRLVRIAALWHFTHLVNREATGRQGTEAMRQKKEGWEVKGGISVLPPHPSSIQSLYPFHPTMFCLCTHSEPQQEQVFTFQIALKFESDSSPSRSANQLFT